MDLWNFEIFKYHHFCIHAYIEREREREREREKEEEAT